VSSILFCCRLILSLPRPPSILRYNFLYVVVPRFLCTATCSPAVFRSPPATQFFFSDGGSMPVGALPSLSLTVPARFPVPPGIPDAAPTPTGWRHARGQLLLLFFHLPCFSLPGPASLASLSTLGAVTASSSCARRTDCSPPFSLSFSFSPGVPSFGA